MRDVRPTHRAQNQGAYDYRKFCDIMHKRALTLNAYPGGVLTLLGMRLNAVEGWSSNPKSLAYTPL